jgi:hypothetical protein
MNLCACGQPATANGRECPKHWRERISTVVIAYHPTASAERVSQTGGRIDPTASKAHERRLEDYRSVRAEGIQPKGTTQDQIDEAKRLSDETGAAFDAGARGRAVSPA